MVLPVEPACEGLKIFLKIPIKKLRPLTGKRRDMFRDDPEVLAAKIWSCSNGKSSQNPD
jgi:hypothetical protein